MPQIDTLVNTIPQLKDYIFKTNKNFPNRVLPLLIYKNACLLGKQKTKAVQLLQKVFNKIAGKIPGLMVYTFHHYHSNTHECMGIAYGKAWVIFGGTGGRRYCSKKATLL